MSQCNAPLKVHLWNTLYKKKFKEKEQFLNKIKAGSFQVCSYGTHVAYQKKKFSVEEAILQETMFIEKIVALYISHEFSDLHN